MLALNNFNIKLSVVPSQHKRPTTSLALSHPFRADLDSGLAERLDGVVGIDAEDCARLTSKRVWTDFLAFSLRKHFEVVCETFVRYPSTKGGLPGRLDPWS